MNNHLAAIMGERLQNITDVHRGTGISRSTLVRLYYRREKNVNLDTLITLCNYFDVPLSELIEYTPQHESVTAGRRSNA